MSDDPKIISTDNTQSSNDSVSNSPWDDDLPKEEGKKPMIVGGLEKKPQSEDEANPVPFNIPKDIIEQKEKEKISAVDVVKTSPANEAPKNAGVAALILPKTDKPESKPAPTAQNGPTIIHQPVINNEIQKNPPVAPAAELPKTQGMQPVVNEGQKRSVSPLGFLSRFKKSDESPKQPTNKPSSPLIKKIMLVVGVLLIIVSAVFLTENGIISIGFENIYGAIGVEGLWGGLSQNPEQALAISLSKSSSNLEFKGSGSISISASKSSNSKIIGPLLSMTGISIALNDQAVVPRAKAFLSVADIYDTTDTNSYDVYDESDTSIDETANTPIDDGSSTFSEPSDSVASPNTSDLTGSEDNSITNDGTQNTTDSYVPEQTVIKEINSEFKLLSTKNGFQSDFTIKKIIGTEDNLSLILSGNDLLLKTNEKIKYSEKFKANKWLDYKIPNLSDGNALSEMPQVSPSSGFSISGDRVSNEKINGTRCYRYYLSKVEIGDALQKFGLSKDSVQSISGDVWIGIKDKLMRKADLTIIPSSSLGVTKIHVVLNYSDYGVANNLLLPSSSEKITATSSDIPTGTVSVDDGAEVDNPEDSDGSIALESDVSRDVKRRSDLDKIKVALDSYKAANGRYPISIQLDKTTSQASILKSSLVPTYLSEMPSDPKSTAGWFYGYTSSDGIKYILSCQIENPADAKSTVVNGTRLYWVKN